MDSIEQILTKSPETLSAVFAYLAWKKSEKLEDRFETFERHFEIAQRPARQRPTIANIVPLIAGGAVFLMFSSTVFITGCKTTTVSIPGVGEMSRVVPIIGSDDFKIRLTNTNGLSIEAGSTTTGAPEVLREARQLLESARPVP